MFFPLFGSNIIVALHHQTLTQPNTGIHWSFDVPMCNSCVHLYIYCHRKSPRYREPSCYRKLLRYRELPRYREVPSYRESPRYQEPSRY